MNQELYERLSNVYGIIEEFEELQVKYDNLENRRIIYLK